MNRSRKESSMQVLCCAETVQGREILETVMNVFPQAEVLDGVEALVERFRHPLDDPAVAVLVAGTQEALSSFCDIRDLLSRVRVVLVLPDGKHETVAMGYGLQPRFLSHIETARDLDEMTAILGKMIESLR